MIAGLDRFREFFKNDHEYFCLIGGVAAMEWLGDAGLNPRATRDLDLVLIVESLNDRFLGRLWEFIKAGRYENLQRSTGQRIYYRFNRPQEPDYPFMIEIFTRQPDGLTIFGDPDVVPIPAGEDASSLSAILMDDDYYALVRDHRAVRQGLSLLTPESLILLKGRAWLDLSRRKSDGHSVNDKDIKKHRNDIFKLALLLPTDQPMSVAQSILKDLHEFLNSFPEDSPEWESIRQASGIKNRMPQPIELRNILFSHYVYVER